MAISLYPECYLPRFKKTVCLQRTALHLAAMYGSHEQVQMLLQRDANVGIPDADGKTPLHWAINSKHQYSCAIVQALIEHMPSVINWQDHDGRTSLHLAVAEGGYNLVKTLVCFQKLSFSFMPAIAIYKTAG